MQDFKLLIGGKLVSGATVVEVINPATAKGFAMSPCASPQQLEEAIAAAKAAFPKWSATPVAERADALVRLATALEAREDEFARLLTEEQGKPLAHAVGEIRAAIGLFRYFAAYDFNPRTVLQDDASEIVVQCRSPLGVVAAINPWNFPMMALAMKVAPALLTGNTVVIKPAPTTPLTTLKFGELCSFEIPAGVVNVITDQNDLGDLLTGHADVAKIAFTGSTATGKRIMASAAGTLKRLTLELGGNDAAIVLDDADIGEVAPKIFAGAMSNSGQVCLAIKRLYVHDSQYEAMCEALAGLARDAIVDDGLKQGVDLGPLQNQAQFSKFIGYLDEARASGNIIAGGKVIDRDGYFAEPTIVRDIADNSRLVVEEQFGPILPVLRYTDIDDAIARANDSQYGLGGTVWTSDSSRALDVAAQFDSGVTWINNYLKLAPAVAFAGAKQSGIGAQTGQAGLEEYTQRKIVSAAK